MPQYYNPGLFPASYVPVGYPQQPISVSGANPMTYMYQVDGENAARAWQPPMGQQLPPNTIVPLFDVDGEHIYFKSTDMYGRMNPIRKGRVLFDTDPIPVLNPGQSGNVSSEQSNQSNNEKYMTKDDMESMEQRIIDALNRYQNSKKQLQQNSNPQNNRGGDAR